MKNINFWDMTPCACHLLFAEHISSTPKMEMICPDMSYQQAWARRHAYIVLPPIHIQAELLRNSGSQHSGGNLSGKQTWLLSWCGNNA
jgi:hypothetical protein